MEDKFLAEPSGAVALAALLSGKFPYKNNKVVIVISGGNVDSKNIKEVLLLST